eukprot:Gb_38465 [translate_table: standard]
MKKTVVLKVEIHCEKCKTRAMKTVAGVEGVESVAIDVKENKITVIGEADPVCLASKLRKFGCTELISVAEKKEEKKPAEKKPEEKKPAEKKDPPVTYVYLPQSCNRCCDGYYVLSAENPNSCCII